MRAALFLHTQKTAGTSIQEMARRYYGSDQVIGYIDHSQLGLKGCAEKAFVSGHFGFEFAKHLMPGRYCFIFLREPCERVYSLYRYYQANPYGTSSFSDGVKELSFEQFLDAAAEPGPYRAQIWNNQAWQLAYGWYAELVGAQRKTADDFDPDELLNMAIRNLAKFDYVGFVDTFNVDTKKIFRALGARWVRLHRSNVSPASLRFSDLPSSTVRKIVANNELDLELYRIARERRRQAAPEARMPWRWLGA